MFLLLFFDRIVSYPYFLYDLIYKYRFCSAINYLMSAVIRLKSDAYLFLFVKSINFLLNGIFEKGISFKLYYIDNF